jgi:hypothetical protein
MSDETKGDDNASIATASPETLRFMIEQKMSYVNSVVNICMLWWISSIVFCGSILGAVWLNRDGLWQTAYVLVLGIVLFVFLFYIVSFGILAADRLGLVQQEIAVLADLLNYARLSAEVDSAKLNVQEGFFHTEIVTFQRSMRIGAGSFALIFVVWIGFWIFLSGTWLYRTICVLWLLLWWLSHRRIFRQWWGVVKEII